MPDQDLLVYVIQELYSLLAYIKKIQSYKILTTKLYKSLVSNATIKQGMSEPGLSDWFVYPHLDWLIRGGSYL